MNFKCWDEEGYSVELSEQEKQGYIDYVKSKNPGQKIDFIKVKLDGDYVNLEYKTIPVPFEHIRRITGYLVGDTRYWNDAKQDELKDRVKHNK